MQPSHPLCWDVITQDGNTHIYLNGELSRNTLMPLWDIYKKVEKEFFPPNPHIVWHFDKIVQLDSAGFALLCDFLHAGEQRGTQQIATCSPQFLTLADLFGLTSWMKGFLPATT
ncbi:anti-sigma-factor antagonist [Actinobacillus delphinicola]|uniref:Anti-sigma-factor antagonist n=2 Tax=Actinobacillus delphinicola TaxID=51161 RepID=A0A448TV63_9PAST|nr:anti-sigma-factor antagonist [Actinobacillus delphinicola]